MSKKDFPPDHLFTHSKDRGRRNALIVAGLGIAALLVLIVGAVVAAATDDDSPATTYPTTSSPYAYFEQDYLREVKDIGIGHEDGNAGLLEAGYEVCDVYYDDYSIEVIARQVYRGTPSDVSYEDTYGLVTAAVDHLC